MSANERPFSGFSKDFAPFLLSLRFCNTKDALEENKARYRKLITQPLTALYEELLPIVREAAPFAETKPARCMSSMYNDMRFTRAPLKEHMYLRFRAADTGKDQFGFFFDMGTDDYRYGFQFYKHTAHGKDLILRDMLAHADLYEKALVEAMGLELRCTGLSYARDKAPEFEGRPIHSLINSRQIQITRTRFVARSVFTSELVDELSAAFLALSPIFAMIREALVMGSMVGDGTAFFQK